jgi:hypothetical protein
VAISVFLADDNAIIREGLTNRHRAETNGAILGGGGTVMRYVGVVAYRIATRIEGTDR